MLSAINKEFFKCCVFGLIALILMAALANLFMAINDNSEIIFRFIFELKSFALVISIGLLGNVIFMGGLCYFFKSEENKNEDWLTGVILIGSIAIIWNVIALNASFTFDDLTRLSKSLYMISIVPLFVSMFVVFILAVIHSK